MKKNLIIGIVSTALLVLAAGLAVYSFYPTSQPVAKTKTTAKAKKQKKNKRPRVVASTNRVAAAMAARLQKTDDNERDEEAKLTAAELAILRELREGAEDDNFHRVRKAVEKIQELQRKKGIDAVPPYLREEAVEALGEFLPGSLPELIGFMGDTDSDVLADVLSQFEDAIDNSGLGDRALADILVSVSKVLTDDDALDALFCCVENEMRNSVAVKTYTEILQHGTEAAKERVWESIEDFTGEDDVKSKADLENWLKENPDDEDDEEFYGPEEDDDKDDD